ncbi:MAG TPA: ester cyclase [Acidobacteriota bacterium]
MRRVAVLIACIVGLVVLPSFAAEQDKTRLEENKAIVRGYINDVINKGSLEAFDKYFSEKVVFNNSPGFRAGLSSLIQSLRSGFPDFQVTIEDQIAEGDKVVTRVKFHGTHRGEYRGVAPTGKVIEYPGIAIDRIADGKVVEMWHIAESTVILRELGFSVSPPKP